MYLYKETIYMNTEPRFTKTKDGVILGVPYESQLDNKNNPTGSCNVTCCSMVLKYYGVRGNGNGQLEDQLYQWMIDNRLSRHSPQDLQKLLIARGVKDDYRSTYSIDQLKASLDKGHPIILHGYFTRFGHIIVLKGYNSKGFIVLDPYGEYFSTGYNTSVSGKDLTYSYRLITSVACDPGVSNSIWAHVVSK
jgi:uncharacterized protein YvpB